MPSSVEGINGIWRDEFPGASLRSFWTARTIGAGGGSASVSGSLLTLATGPTSGGGIELVSTGLTMKPPCRVIVSLSSISQRIANQELEIALVRSDAAIDATSVDHAAFAFTGTSATAVDLRANSQGDTNTLAAQTAVTTAGTGVYEVDLTTDEVWFYNGPVDSSGTSKTNATRLTRKVPDPGIPYIVRLRAKNTGAAASTTSMIIDSVLVEDYNSFSIELARSRGSSAAGEQLPVNVVALPTAGSNTKIITPVIWWDDSTTPLGAAATFTGTGRDVLSLNANSGSTSGNIGCYGGRFRGWSVSDVAGTLYIAASRDNVTFYRVDAQPAALVGSNYVAWLELPVLTRYARVEYVNGAGAQGTFVIGSQATAVS